MIQYTRNHGLKRLTAVTMPSNQGMINLARKLGFSIDVQMDAGIVNLELTL
jgi:acetyltransferase